MRHKSLPVALLAFLIPLAARADDPKVGFLDRVYKSGDKEYKYVLFVPHDYKGDKEYPLILFLHGAGETGTEHVGCCDDSPSRHATAHHSTSGHALIRSLEPGEEWTWCYEDQVGMLIPEIRGHTRIPPSPMLIG